MSVSGGPDIVENGLVLYLDASNARSYLGSGTTWTDLCGNGNTGTLSNGPAFNNGNIIFDGINDFVSITDSVSLNISSAITLQCIFFINSYVNWAGLIGRNSNTKSVYGLNLSPTSQRLRFNYNNISPWNLNVESISLLQLNRWIHSTATYDGTNVSIYINGILDKTQNIGSITFDTAAGFSIDIGYDNPGGDEFFNGSIAQVQIYNRSLTAQEILQNFNATRSRFGI